MLPTNAVVSGCSLLLKQSVPIAQVKQACSKGEAVVLTGLRKSFFTDSNLKLIATSEEGVCRRDLCSSYSSTRVDSVVHLRDCCVCHGQFIFHINGCSRLWRSEDEKVSSTLLYCRGWKPKDVLVWLWFRQDWATGPFSPAKCFEDSNAAVRCRCPTQAIDVDHGPPKS